MAWVYERVPSLGVLRSLQMFPRLFRWKDRKIPLKTVNAELLLNSIDSKGNFIYFWQSLKLFV